LASDEHIQITLDRLLAGLRGPLEAALRAHGDKATEDVRRQAQEQLAQLRDAASRKYDDARRSGESQIAELRRMLDELKRDAQQQIDNARQTLDTEVAAVRAKAKADLEEAHRIAQSRLEDVRRTLEGRVAALDRERDDIRAELHSARQEAATARESAARLRDSDDLTTGLRSLDDASSLTDVFDRLVAAAALHVERVALLIVKGDRLRAWQLLGFANRMPGAEPVDLPLSDSGIAGDAVRARQETVAVVGEGDRLPSFATGDDAREAIAIPVTVAGTVVAVLYADASQGDVATARWQVKVDLLSRYASRVLETIAIQQAAGIRRVQPVARPSVLPTPGHPPGGFS
jgi:hypothetical protein